MKVQHNDSKCTYHYGNSNDLQKNRHTSTCTHTQIIGRVKETIDALPTLLGSLRTFSDQMIMAIDDVNAKIRSVKQTEIKHEPRFVEACGEFRIMADNAYSFVYKVDDFIFFGQGEARLNDVKKAIGGDDFNPLIDFVNELQSYLRDAGQLYKEFIEASKVATRSCVRAAETCRCRSKQANKDKKESKETGEKKAKAAKAIGTTASVVAFVPTLGIGTIVGAIATQRAVSAIRSTTDAKVSHYEKLVEGFNALGTDLDALGLIATDMDKQASDVHLKLELIAERTDEIKASKHHDKSSLCYSLDVLCDSFKECFKDSSECRKQVHEMKGELESQLDT